MMLRSKRMGQKYFCKNCRLSQ